MLSDSAPPVGNVPVRVLLPADVHAFMKGRIGNNGYGRVNEWAQSVIDDAVERIAAHPEVLGMHALGWTNQQIAEQTGLVIGEVRRVINTAGRKSNRQPMNVGRRQ